MPEQQNIEYKSSWHDDHLKWLCGFANAQGGRVYLAELVNKYKLVNNVGFGAGSYWAKIGQ